MNRAIWWIRRDFRLSDNTALFSALHDAQQVVPLFVLDDALLRSTRTRGPRMAWMLEALQALDADLHRYGGQLILRRGEVVGEVIRAARDAEASAIYFNRDYSPYAMRRDARLRQAAVFAGLVVRDFKDAVIHEADEIRTQSGKPYEVYTPYRKAWGVLPKPEPMADLTDSDLSRLRAPDSLTSLPIPTARELRCDPADQPIVAPGEATALARLRQFTAAAIYRYADDRNSPAIDGTSILSPYLRWGMVSPRICYAAALEAAENAADQPQRDQVQIWLNELVWREFNYHVLAKNPHIVRHSYRASYDKIEWENNAERFRAWCEGRTGYPIVDAAMRQLNTTGWMHNRARMIVASFLCKDLLIDWRWGEQYFMTRLLDGDVASNVGGWQWTAGTGTDAAPYFRVFNPTSQGAKVDPGGHYVRRWVPELRHVPDRLVHAPHQMTATEQHQALCQIGVDYPAPLVDHAAQRARALALYSATRS